VAPGVDHRLVEAWIEVGRRRASTVAVTTHKACVIWDGNLVKRITDQPAGSVRGKTRVVSVNVGPLVPSLADSTSQ
jgi:hypothetical protein